MRKVVIAGGRDFRWPHIMEEKLEEYFGPNPQIEVVSGEASGADSLGKDWALQRGLQVATFPADWMQHGKAAGPIRNREMAEYADEVVVFWNGRSRGTKHMIQAAVDRQLPVHIFPY